MTYKLPPPPEPYTSDIEEVGTSPGGDPEYADVSLFSSDQMQAYAIAAIEAQGVPDGWREFVQRVAGQKPEKPDYWSACGQCERNISDAEDLLASAPPAPQASVVQQEPVYLVKSSIGASVWVQVSQAEYDEAVYFGVIKRVLYTHPAQQAKPQPLSDEQIVPMFRRRVDMKTEGEKDPWFWYAWGVEDGETYHGIKGE